MKKVKQNQIEPTNLTIQLHAHSQDPENNEYIQIWTEFGCRPSKLTFYASINSGELWEKLKNDPKHSVRYTEAFYRGDEMLMNCRHLVKISEGLYASFVELAEEEPNINTLHFYYNVRLFDHNELLSSLYKEFGQLFKLSENNTVAQTSKDNFFIVNYEKEMFEMSPVSIEKPKNNLDLNYNQSIVDSFANLVQIINSDQGGLIFLYGPRGCGKTFYLKQIIPSTNRSFFYFPVHLLENTYIFNLFLNSIKRQPKSVLILEDTESFFGQGNRSSKLHVDAILSSLESLVKSNDLQILLVLNVENEDSIEEDLWASNSIIFDQYFDKLLPEVATKLSQKLKKKNKYTEPVKLSHVYNNKRNAEKRKPGYQT